MADAVVTLDPAVQDYLHEFPFLVEMLPKIQEKARAYFGEDAILTFEVFTYPESEGDRDLFVLIAAPLEPNEARERLAAFDEEWWLDTMLEANGRLNVDLAS